VTRDRTTAQRRGALLLVGIALAGLVVACGGTTPASPTPAGSSPSTALPAAASSSAGGASPSPTVLGSPAALASPVVGLLVKIDASGLTKVTGFTLRLADGTEVPFTIGVLENGAVFPPGHLAEHMSSSSPVKVSFRDEGGVHVVYRLEDGS
jgi:hypothetical protein